VLIPTELLVALAFYLFAAAAIGGAIGIILARGIFRSALFLILTLASVAAVFVILGADFLGAVQVLIYVGAIMVLIIFGIMLTPQQVELPDIGGPGQAAAAVVVAAALFAVTAVVTVTSQWPRSSANPIDVPTTELIGLGLFNTYVLPFEIASILLLVAMIGAIVIAREE
jgi:NADH:ubiquinone oxidoreductase subunit 6 (subunit J)